MSPTLEDQERHLLVKVIDRILYKLDDLVRPYVHKILVVIEPLLIDEDYYARVEGREIISNLAKVGAWSGVPDILFVHSTYEIKSYGHKIMNRESIWITKFILNFLVFNCVINIPQFKHSSLNAVVLDTNLQSNFL